MTERNSTLKRRLERQLVSQSTAQAPEACGDQYLYEDETKYVWLRASGEQIAVQPTTTETKFVSGELRKFAGGSIELIDLGPKAVAFMGEGYHGFRDEHGLTSAYGRGGLVRNGWVLVVNENGINLGLPTNENASALWGARLAGDVLLCRRSAIG
jgi:hypothetical protein